MPKNWVETDGTVATVEESPTRGGTQYSVVFTYKVDGGWYGGSFTTNEAYRVGDTISVTYDPADPDRNNFTEQAKRLHWLIGGLVAAALLVIVWAEMH